MDTTHRKIELQSPADLVHLEAIAKRAARAKIDLHLPPSAAPVGEDALRRDVGKLVDEFIRNTFAGVRQNVSVNGMDSAEVAQQDLEEFEPFDTRLADRIRALESTKMTLTEKVADLRRTAPSESARRVQQAFLAESHAQEAEMQEQGDRLLTRATEEGRLDLGEPPRWDEVRDTWESGTEGLVALKGGLTETVARLERARTVIGYLEGRHGCNESV